MEAAKQLSGPIQGSAAERAYTAHRLTVVVLYRNIIDATVRDTASVADPSLSAAAPIRSSVLTDPTFLLNFHPSRSCLCSWPDGPSAVHPARTRGSRSRPHSDDRTARSTRASVLGQRAGVHGEVALDGRLLVTPRGDRAPFLSHCFRYARTGPGRTQRNVANLLGFRGPRVRQHLNTVWFSGPRSSAIAQLQHHPWLERMGIASFGFGSGAVGSS